MRLPEEIRTLDGLRIADYLRRMEQRAPSNSLSLELTVYGSVAVSLYLSDEKNDPLSIHYTSDIDINATGSLNDQFFNSFCPRESLQFQVRPVELWLLHPDWERDRVELSRLVGLMSWRLWCLSPRDLILSKLLRYIRDDEDRDAVDCARLAARYLQSKSDFAQDLEEALQYYAPYVKPGDLRRLRNVPDEIFER